MFSRPTLLVQSSRSTARLPSAHLRHLSVTSALLFSLTFLGCQSQPPASRHDVPANYPSERESRPQRYDSQRDDGSGRRENQRQRGERNHNRDRQSSAENAAFDFYLLNLSWSPEFCATHPGKPECSAHPGFVLHGLWPQSFTGAYPEHCSDDPGPANPQAFQDLYPDTGLLRHEWQTHGTCSGLAPDAFFTLARRAVHFVAIPRELDSLNRPTSMPPEQILGLFAAANPGLPRESLALSCGNNYLTAVEVCLDKSIRPIACQEVRSCRANTVRIPPR